MLMNLQSKRIATRRSCLRRTKAHCAFSRVDLIVVVSVAAILLLWFGFGCFGERARIARCAGNLKGLGQAMQSFARDHNGGLPAAGIDFETTKISWDTALFPYQEPKLAKLKGAYEQRQLLTAVSKRFFCPSEPIPRGGFPRSYAMSARRMNYGWPPTPNDKTGVGLWWDKKTVLNLIGGDAAQETLKNPELLPRLKVSILPDPGNTLLLTELIERNNTLENVQQTTVREIAQQQQAFKDGGSRFHFGRFNYLMVDGHVETLSPLQTGALDGSAGIWTLKKD
jgi:prepilin-type processing-associated H-X9-DG protein